MSDHRFVPFPARGTWAETRIIYCERCGATQYAESAHSAVGPCLEDQAPQSPAVGPIVITPWSPPFETSGSTTVAPWCSICKGNHVPGMGACTTTYSVVSR